MEEVDGERAERWRGDEERGRHRGEKSRKRENEWERTRGENERGRMREGKNNMPALYKHTQHAYTPRITASRYPRTCRI